MTLSKVGHRIGDKLRRFHADGLEHVYQLNEIEAPLAAFELSNVTGRLFETGSDVALS